VFRHDNVSTSFNGNENENECSWLLRTPATESFDLIDLAESTEWFVWKGEIETDYRVSIECNECNENSDCNYAGECKEEKCVCDDDHFGSHCHLDTPCKMIGPERDNTAALDLIEDLNDDQVKFLEIYGRPMYVRYNMTGKPHSFLGLTDPEDGEQLQMNKHFGADTLDDDDFFQLNNETSEFQELLKNYTFILEYTGQRWYGRMVPPTIKLENLREATYHAFWNNTFGGKWTHDNSTVIISDPASGFESPVGIDFYEMRRRNEAIDDIGVYDYKYGPYGVLIPLTKYKGSGYFHCFKDGK